MSATCPSTTTAATVHRPPSAPKRLAAPGLALALALLPLAAPAARAEAVDRVVLVVNDEVATLLDYQHRLGERLAAVNRQELDAADRRRRLDRLPKEVFQDMLDEMLLLSRANQLNIHISNAEVASLIDQIRQANNFDSEEDLRRAVAQSGMTWDGFKNELIKGQLTREVINREVRSRVKLEDDDLRRYYKDNPELFREPEQRRLREIVVLDSSGLSLGEMQSLAQDLHKRLAAGEDPASVVEDTTDPKRTSGVIDLGWVPVGDLDPSLEQAVQNLQTGQWSDPVSGRGGLHLLQLVEHKAARMKPFDEVKNQILAREQDRLYQKEFPKYLKELQDKSYVVSQPPPEAAGYERLAEEEAPAATADPLEVFRHKPGQEPKPDQEPAASPSTPEPPPPADQNQPTPPP